jgi:hypothetical protein
MYASNKRMSLRGIPENNILSDVDTDLIFRIAVAHDLAELRACTE